MIINVLNELPAGLLDAQAHELQALLGRPTIVHLPGNRQPALFVSVLLHGNEVSGWNGLRRLLRAQKELPRAMTLFLGNLTAAAEGQRALPGQPDYNRIWRAPEGADPPRQSGREGPDLAHAVTSAIAGQPWFAAVDLHNNTGHNPHYAVVTDLDPRNLGLGSLFSDKAVYVQEPATTLTGLFAGRCPAVTLELGPVGDERCEGRAHDILDQYLRMGSVPAVTGTEFSLYRSQVRVHVRPGVEFSFADEDLDTPLVLTGGMEAVNFHSLPVGAPFGASRYAVGEVLQVLDAAHRDVTHDFFLRDGDDILLKRPVIPAMYTIDAFVVRQDCLCYFMEQMRGPGT